MPRGMKIERPLGPLPETNMAVEGVRGIGTKSCTCWSRQSFETRYSVSRIASSAVQPGWPLMKYGTRYCSFPALRRGGLEFFFEPLEQIERRLAHQLQDRIAGVFGRNLQMAADEMFRQQIQIVVIFQGQVVANAGGDKAVNLSRARLALPQHGLHQSEHPRIVGLEMRTQRRKQATAPPARLALAAGHAVHVGRRPAQIADRSGKLRMLGQTPGLIQNRILRTGDDLLSLVETDRAEMAAAKAAAMGGDAELHGLRSTGSLAGRTADRRPA